MRSTAGPQAPRRRPRCPRARTASSSRICEPDGAVSTVIVYVHGLWQRGAEALWLRRRLARDLAADVRTFSYPSVTADATANARALAEYLSAIRADTLHLIGHSLGGELLVPRERRWQQHRDLGVIVGDLGVGLGRLVGTLGGASDGTILVEETQIEGVADRVVLRVSHTGMVFSAVVARQAGAFLSTGRFSG